MRRDDVARAIDDARGFAATRAVARRAREGEDAQTYRRSARVTRVARPRADIDESTSADEITRLVAWLDRFGGARTSLRRPTDDNCP